jgi:hypothetical protein
MHVYVVNDFGAKPKSDAPVQFCKTHVIARFDIELPLDTSIKAEVDSDWPPTVYIFR